MPITVELLPHNEAIVREKMQSGLYASASDVINEALLLMQEKEQYRRVTSIEALRQEMQVGLNSGASTLWDADEVKRLCRSKKQMTSL